MKIQNYQDLATTPLRKDALEIIEAAYEAIDTEQALTKKVSVRDGTLRVDEHVFDLTAYERIVVIGFGKASCKAAEALEKILSGLIKKGIVIDTVVGSCQVITGLQGTHPRPSEGNVEATKAILDITEDLTDKDLVLVVVSGGGSSLLCYPIEECYQNALLYDEFLSVGGTITELNVIRKHISELKGGGLARHLYPATVVGLIFSDVPCGTLADVASGPTFYDETTVDDAKRVLQKYGITKEFSFTETPKEQKYFEKVTNVPIVTNDLAFDAMMVAAKERGYQTELLSKKLYKQSDVVIGKYMEKRDRKTAVIGGGEIVIAVPCVGGVGGRNTHLVLEALPHLAENELFVSFASDGRDNTIAAGAIADRETKTKMVNENLNPEEHKNSCNSFPFFEKTGDLIMTGETGSNVADLHLFLQG